MSDKTDNSESIETKELDVTKTQTNQSKSSTTTPASSVTGIPVSKLKVPSNFGGSIGSVSKIGRLCSHAAPKAGPPPRDSTSMSRESDDHFNSFNSTHTDLYQETIKRFTRSSLSPEMDRFSATRFSFLSNVKSPQSSEANRRRSSYDFYVEATGRRRSSDQGAVLTQDTEQFIIGQKVWVGGIRPGQIAYIGETHFAPGEWAGVVLDEPNGKNDGCVAGKRYFQCEPKRGIFSRLTRLTLAPLAGIQTPTSPLQKNSPERSRTGSPTTSIRSSYVGKHGLTVGDRVIVSSGFGSRPGILRYLGETKFATGNWCGVELDEATGKNDGSVDGVRYFECKPKYGVFVPIAKVSLSPSSKKSRLSRTGSRESLTSIGTMNSIATTNTSRLRMSSQRKSPTIKPMATPKHQFTMQELLRDKQSHIEQLMIERELDREDAQSQALQYQKNINELKTRITQLEHQLIEERKKAEDLQFSIDEATFCGDELSAQTQVYREKIQDLENIIKQLTSTNNSTQQHSPAPAFEIRIVELETKLREQSNLYETQKTKLIDELQRLQENVKYLRSENENLQKELVAKDETFEKFSLSESGLASMRHELDLFKQEHEKERSHIVKDFTVRLAEKAEEAQQLSKEVMSLKNIISSAEGERCNVDEKCQILEAECQNRNEEIEKLTDKLVKMSSELAVREAECSTLDEIIKTQQTEQAKEKQTEIDKLIQNKVSLETMNSKLEKDLQELNKDLQNIKEANAAMKSEIFEITKNEREKDEILMNLESQLNMINKERESLISTNEELNKTLKDISQMFEKEKSTMKQLTTSVNEKALQLTKTTQELTLNKNLVVQLKAQIDELNNTSEQKINVKLQEINALQQQLTIFQDKSTHLESNTALVVQQLNKKISDLDKRNKTLEEDYNNSQALNKELQQRSIKHDELLAEKASELKSNELALENTNNVLEKFKKEYEIAVSSCRLVEEQLKSSEEKNAQYQLNVSDLERKLETFTTKCDTLVGQNETLQQDVLTARTSCSKMQNALKRLNEEIVSKQTALSNLESAENDQRIRMEGEIEELKQKLTNANQSIVDLKEGATKLKQEIEQKNRKFSELEEKCVKHELMISDNHRQHELIQNKCEILLKENDALQKDIDTLRTTTVDSSSELIKLSQDLNTQRKNYDDLLDRSNSERATLESQLQARHQQIDALCNQVETLTEELKITHETSLERFELVKQQEEKIRKQELEANDVARKLESLAAKYENLQTQNANLQSELSSLRSGSADTNAEIVKLTEELTAKQKAFQELEDKTNSDRHSYQNQIQELKQTMQTQQHEMDQLQQQVITLDNSKLTLSVKFETVKRELLAKAQQEVQELKSAATLKQNKLRESFETQLKNSEKHKISLEEGISSLQQQIHLLQEEMLKSQIAYKAKEAELQRQVEILTREKEQLGEILTKTKSDKCQALESLQQEETQLMQRLEELAKQLKEKNIALTQAQSEVQQMRLIESNNKADHQLALQKLQHSLDLLKSESEYKNKLLGEDKQKIAELKSMIEALKKSNQNISTTNAQLAAALEHLEQEKYETNNIFELFEMESDQNMNKLVETLTNLKQELNNTRLQLGFMQTELKEKEERIQGANELLQKSELNLNGCQKEMLEKTTKLQELQQANHELTTRINELEETIKQKDDLKLQLDEYKTIVDEMDDSSKEKSSNFYKLQQELHQLEVDKVKAEGKEKELQIENKTLQRKLELMEFEKTREIVALQGRINDLPTFAYIQQSNGTNDHHVALPSVAPITEDSTAHINFLNSIIADMQKKNDTLKAKIETLEAIPTDFTKPHVFDLISKRKPAPRLFCDICDEFDKHETEDCPLQASDDREYSPPPTSTPKKDRKLPEPRKYCENCEVFGHDTAQCDDDECY